MLKPLEVKDEHILYVKLADRMYNMRTITGHSSLATQQRIAEETLQFFVPARPSACSRGAERTVL